MGVLLRLGITLLVIAGALAAGDWPQFLGPGRDGVSNETVGADWRVVWKKEVGAGFAAPVVAAEKLILFHRQANREIVEAIDAATGAPVWRFDYPTGYVDDFGFDEGPRATPVIADDRVFTFGAEGMLHALDFATGKKVWSVDTRRQFRAEKGFFGAASGLLVESGRVLLNVGGGDGAGIVAFDGSTGRVLWKATNDAASYSAPTAATIGDARHAIFFTRAGLVDLNPTDGGVRLAVPWRSRTNASVNAATPLVVGNLVFVSASYGTGAAVLDLTAERPAPLWSSDDAMSNHYATSVYRDGYLYGYHGRQEFGPELRCVEFKTGKVAWSVPGFRAGTVTLAGDRLLLMRESGELVLASASPQGFQRLAAAQILPTTVRAYPALANGMFYVRNETTLAAVDMRPSGRESNRIQQ